jgi:hypothetical protein
MFTIDPGVSGTGWVAWIDAQPVAAGIVETLPGAPWEARTEKVVKHLSKAYELLIVHTGYPHPMVICEMMEFYQTASGSAPWVTGDLQRILVLAGWFCGQVGVPASRVVFVRPSEWKGQLPKKVVTARVTKLLGKETCDRLRLTSHAWDAAGIGLWYLEKL